MTALHAAGGGLLLAFHIPHVVQEVGSIAGFAAVFGLAILAALYFSQARDLRRLREWAGRAPERAAEGQASASPVPGRVVATPQRTAQAVQAPVPVTPAGAGGGGTAATTAQPPAPQGANGAPPAEGEKTDDEEKKEGSEDATPDGEKAAEGADGEKAADGDRPAQEEKKAPGMPAPASAAAAAAGAGAAAAASGAAAPSTAGAGAPIPTPSPSASPGAPTPRPPGSVLPPRTGAVQPVRRIPAGTAVGNAAISRTGVLGTAAPERKRNPAYVALAVVGVLVLGAGAAIGVPKLVNGGSSAKSSKKHAKKATTSAKALPPISASTITVSALNATNIPGLAAQIGDQAQSAGFNLGDTAQVPGILEGTKTQQANTVVMYVPGHVRDARLVAKKLKIRAAVQAIDSQTRQLGGDATVVVVVGRDQTH